MPNAKPALLAAALALLLGAPAHAADPAATTSSAVAATGFDLTTLRELDNDTQARGPNGLTVDQMEDMDLVTAAGERVGEVEEVLGATDGVPAALVVEVGGFLGIGDKEVVVGFDQVRLDGDRFATTLSSEQLKALPEWKD